MAEGPRGLGWTRAMQRDSIYLVANEIYESQNRDSQSLSTYTKNHQSSELRQTKSILNFHPKQDSQIPAPASLKIATSRLIWLDRATGEGAVLGGSEGGGGGGGAAEGPGGQALREGAGESGASWEEWFQLPNMFWRSKKLGENCGSRVLSWEKLGEKLGLTEGEGV